MQQSISNLFKEISGKDFSTATPDAIAKVFKQIQGANELMDALNIQPSVPVSLKQIDKSLELYMDELSYEDRIYLVLTLMKLGIFKISFNKSLFDEVDFAFKG